MQYTSRKNFKLKLLNCCLLRLKPVEWLINQLVLMVNIIKSICGESPEVVGLTRLIYRAYYYLGIGKQELRITSQGITSQGQLIEKLYFSILKFLPLEGIEINEVSPEIMKKRIVRAMLLQNPKISRDFYRVTGLLVLNIVLLSGCHLYFFYKIFMFFIYKQYLFAVMQLALSLATLFFGSNTIIFYIGWRKYFQLQISFKEATVAEEYYLKIAKTQPLVVTMLPAYFEETALIKRAIYSACLQNYENNHVFLLLGNEVNSDKEAVVQNTIEVNQIVDELKADLFLQHKIINDYCEKFLLVTDFNLAEISKQLIVLHEICLQIIDWFEKKINEFNVDVVRFPIDRFFVENNLNFQLRYYQEKAYQCLKKHQELKKIKQCSEFEAKCIEFLQESFIESKRVFAAKLEVFMRTKYANLEQEKTKAGNLTAFTSLFGQSWIEFFSETGELILKPDVAGKSYPTPDYMCIFDIDTIAKANYLLRKVVYMEKHYEEKIAIIQSPYRISYPEFTNVASASGMSTTWFLPQYMLYQDSNAAFWQGFNGVINYSAYQSVGGFLAETMTEDTELSLKLRANGYKIVSSHEYQCQTLSPEDLKSIRSQRVRWCSGGLTIAKQLLEIMKQKKIKFKNLFEVYCNFSYILGLSELAVAMLIVWLILSPLYYQYFSLEILPFFVYLISYVFYYSYIARFKISTLIDGLAMNLFLSLNYIQGFFQGIGKVFLKEQKVMFKATARQKSKQRQLSNYDLLALTFLTIWNGIQIYEIYQSKEVFNFFPIYQLLSIFLLLYRFVFGNKRKVSLDKKNIDFEEQRYQTSYRNEQKRFLNL